jgi:hypothetical protein
VAHECAKSAGRHLCSTVVSAGWNILFILARTCISVNLSSLKVMGSNRWRVPSLALSLSESNGSTEVKKQLSRRGDCGTVKLGCYFHTHDFE